MFVVKPLSIRLKYTPAVREWTARPGIVHLSSPLPGLEDITAMRVVRIDRHGGVICRRVVTKLPGVLERKRNLSRVPWSSDR